MERKFIDLKSLKVSDDDPGFIEGYRSVFGEIDEGGDIVVKGFFADGIPEYVESGFTAHSHDWSFKEAAGFPVDAYEDDHGFFVKSQFHSTSDAQDIRTKARERMEAGKAVGFSFGYSVKEKKFIEAKDYKDQLSQYIKPDRLAANLQKAQNFPRIRILLKGETIEDSLVTAPMQKLARATAMKSKSKWESSDDEIRYRAKDAAEFEEDFEIKTIEADPAIHASVGTLKGETSIAVQMLRFPSDEWTLAEAKKWVKEHPDLNALVAEDSKGMLAEEMAETTPSWWQVESAFCRLVRKIAEGAKNSDVTGEFDWRAKINQLGTEFGTEAAAIAIIQIEQYLDSTDDEFYLKGSVADSFESFDKAVAAIEKNTAQMRRNHENRLKEGRVLSSSNRTKIQNCMDSLMALHTELSDLMDMSEPKPKEKEIDVDALRTQSLRIQSSAMRALSS